MKLRTLLAACVLGLASQGAWANPDLNKAITLHAQASAYEILESWVKLRHQNRSWQHIMTDVAPAQMDAFCGYQERLGLVNNAQFDHVRKRAGLIAGARLVDLFGSQLDRKNAQLHLVGTSVHGLEQGYAMVTLEVRPKRPGDNAISMMMSLTSGGNMILCDIGANADIRSGVLDSIGKELTGGN